MCVRQPVIHTRLFCPITCSQMNNLGGYFDIAEQLMLHIFNEKHAQERHKIILLKFTVRGISWRMVIEYLLS